MHSREGGQAVLEVHGPAQHLRAVDGKRPLSAEVVAVEVELWSYSAPWAPVNPAVTRDSAVSTLPGLSAGSLRSSRRRAEGRPLSTCSPGLCLLTSILAPGPGLPPCTSDGAVLTALNPLCKPHCCAQSPAWMLWTQRPTSSILAKHPFLRPRPASVYQAGTTGQTGRWAVCCGEASIRHLGRQ